MSARTVSFTAMKDGTRDDYRLLEDYETAFFRGTAERVLRALRAQGEDGLSGYKISRLEHGLQCATRAWRAGADEDWVIGALLHDIGDGLAPQNHDAMAAAILKPYLREEVHWCVGHHGVFQMAYYAHHYGGNPNEREKFRDHPYFQSCSEFCENWDQASFDPDYDSLPLDFFVPLVGQVFARPAYAAEILKPGFKRPLGDAQRAKDRAK